jgi:membrane protease YdiL (CAAX protease family)
MKPNWALSLFAIAVCITFHYSTYKIAWLAWFGQVSWPLLVAYLVWRYRLNPADSLGWRLPSPRDWGLAVLVALAMVWVGACVIDLQDGFFRAVDYDASKDYREVQRTIEEIKEEGVVFAVLGAAVWTSIREELVFRGIGLFGLARSWGAVFGIAASAMLFGLAHGSVGRLLPTALLGAGFGLLAIGSRSVFPAVLAHALNNFIALYFFDAIQSSALKVPLGAVSLVVLVLCAIFYNTKSKPRSGHEGRSYLI